MPEMRYIQNPNYYKAPCFSFDSYPSDCPRRPQPPRCLRRLWPQQPGMAKRSSPNRPATNAASTSSTPPQMRAITRIPQPANMASNGCEMPAQISVPTPSPASLFARSSAELSSTSRSSLATSRPSANSTNSSCPATSKTGEIRPCQTGMASFMADRKAIGVPWHGSHAERIRKTLVYSMLRRIVTRGASHGCIAICNAHY